MELVKTASQLRLWVCECRTPTRALLLFVAGALAALGFPPLHLIFFLIPAFTLLFWLIDSAPSRRRAFAVGWFFGVGHFMVAFYWVGSAFLVDVARYGWMAPFAVVGLACGLALFTALTALLHNQITKITRLTVAGRILVFAITWIGLEWLRGWVLTGFPWNLIGSVWSYSDVVMQFASISGILGLGLITLIAATLPALFGYKDNGKTAWAWSAAATGVLALVVGFGIWRLSGAEVSYVPNVSLRLVQPNIAQHLKWKSDLRLGHVRTLARLTVQPSETAKPPTHIIWPETAVPFNLQHDVNLLKGLGPLVPASGYLLTGAPRSNAPVSDQPESWNSMIAVAPDGTVAAVYDKQHLVPFGEYVPWRSVLDITKLTEGRGDFSVGQTDRTLNLEGLPAFSPLICYEIIFAKEVRSLGDVPAWLLNITNDAWFGFSSGPYQHLAITRFRAVEMGLPVVRVANTGISALIGPYGRTIDQLGLGVEGVLDVGLPHRLTGQTIYARFGDLIVLLMVLICGVSLIHLRHKGDGCINISH